MIFQNVKSVTIPEGEVKKIEQNGVVLWKKARLPDAYQEVEYIQSTGTQYIDTGIVPRNTTRLVYDFQRTTADKSTNYWHGWTSAGSQEVFCFGVNNTTGFVARVSSTFTTSFELDYTDLNRHVFDLMNGKQLFDGVQLGNTTIGNTATSSQTIYLFARHIEWGAHIDGYTQEKCYSCQIYNGTTLVRDFIPCYRKSDNAIGLYDLANNKFYSNNGTGTFLKGNDV